MHPCPGNFVAIGRVVVYYARASHTFSAVIKCRYCTTSYMTVLVKRRKCVYSRLFSCRLVPVNLHISSLEYSLPNTFNTGTGHAKPFWDKILCTSCSASTKKSASIVKFIRLGIFLLTSSRVVVIDGFLSNLPLVGASGASDLGLSGVFLS